MKWGPGEEIAAEWPPFRVRSMRLWDTRTTWADIERHPGVRDFTRVEEFLTVAASKGTTDTVMVLGGTPQWAALRVLPGDAAWIGPGSASPPADQQKWIDFVTAFAHHFRGRIGNYEIGNEPNLPMFWNGTSVDFALFVANASKAIAAADPAAHVTANLGVVRRPSDVNKAVSMAKLLSSSPGLDGITVHLYPSLSKLPAATAWVEDLHEELGKVVPRMRVWVTEANIVDGDDMTAPDQGEAINRFDDVLQDVGYERVYWYAWTRHGPENLIQFWPGSPASHAVAENP